MFDIDRELIFDDAAADHVIGVIRSVIGEVEAMLERRATGVRRIHEHWEGLASEWFEQRSTGIDALGAASVEQLVLLAAKIEAARQAARGDRFAQHWARVAREQEIRARAAREAEAREAEAREAQAREAKEAASSGGGAGQSDTQPAGGSGAKSTGRAA